MKSGNLQTQTIQVFFRSLLLILFLTGCSAVQIPQQSTPTAGPEPAEVLFAQVSFDVEVPAKTASQPIYIDILDEVTGLALNPSRYKMESKGNNHFTFQLPVAVGSLVKYRYGRDGATPLVEYTSNGKQIRYRLIQVTAPTVIKDLISGWTDDPYAGKSGRIAGRVYDSKTQTGLPNILVTAGGSQTYSAADGSYLLEGLPPGVHNLAAISLDGGFQPFQQGAQVAADMITPADIPMVAPNQLVNVTFIAHPPAGSPKGIPIRLVGNIISLGNTFADLRGGVSVVAARAPLMNVLPDGSYSLTLSLPAGFDLRYKYTVGDGFWNAEHFKDGNFRVRQMIVPGKAVTMDDSIDAWQAKDFAPITFTVQAPQNTPATDTVSIQFNPYGWTEPIPMWPLGNGQWMYILYSPLNLSGKIGYRYCRNDQCGLADSLDSMGADAAGKSLVPGATAQTVQDTIKQWAFLPNASPQTTISSVSVQPRKAGFYTGVELLPFYRPSWQPYISQGLDRVQQISGGWVVFAPTWSATRANPPVFEPVSGDDATWQDMVQMVVWAQDKGLRIALHPSIQYPDKWWSSAPRDAAWWQLWFDRNRTYLLHFADLAKQVHAGLLVLGDSGISGSLVNGAPVTAPAELDKEWKSLIAEIRARYQGKIAWALPYAAGMKNMPSFLTDVDEIYLEFSAPLSKTGTAQAAEISTEMGRLLDQDVQKFKDNLKKPLILAVSYPSVTGAARGCLNIGAQCVAGDKVDIETIPATVAPNVQEQAVIYDAVLAVVNSRSWIDGFISRGFFPAVTLQDASSSVNGKPASDVLWYWFKRMSVSP